MNREMHSRQLPIFWFTGNSGAGKSTLVFTLREIINNQTDPTISHIARRVIVLDGDEMRATISNDEDLSPEGRRKHNLRVARLAKLLSDSGHLVLVSVIAPFSSVREEISTICHPVWIYVKKDGLQANDRPYEPPVKPDCTVDHDTLSPKEAYDACLHFILKQL